MDGGREHAGALTARAGGPDGWPRRRRFPPGRPDSVLRFEKVLPLLSDPHLVVPALPWFPFAAPVARRGLSSAAAAEAVTAAMAELGYDRYVVPTGDMGYDVAEALAAGHPEHVAAPHLTDVPVPLPGGHPAGPVRRGAGLRPTRPRLAGGRGRVPARAVDQAAGPRRECSTQERTSKKRAANSRGALTRPFGTPLPAPRHPLTPAPALPKVLPPPEVHRLTNR